MDSKNMKGSASIMKETIALIKPVLFHKALANTAIRKMTSPNRKEYAMVICFRSFARLVNNTTPKTKGTTAK
jgi:hypothetical protein